ncbi:MAG: c-type cytochrome [Burkholderiales bacterium]
MNAFPRLSQRKSTYLVKRLKDYRFGSRTNDFISLAAKNFSDDQIKQLAH